MRHHMATVTNYRGYSTTLLVIHDILATTLTFGQAVMLTAGNVYVHVYVEAIPINSFDNGYILPISQNSSLPYLYGYRLQLGYNVSYFLNLTNGIAKSSTISFITIYVTSIPVYYANVAFPGVPNYIRIFLVSIVDPLSNCQATDLIRVTLPINPYHPQLLFLVLLTNPLTLVVFSPVP